MNSVKTNKSTQLFQTIVSAIALPARPFADGLFVSDSQIHANATTSPYTSQSALSNSNINANVIASHPGPPVLIDNKFDWTYGAQAERTLVFSNCHWWESMDHQMTTIITILSVAKNSSSVTVIPTLPSTSAQNASNLSLIGDYFDIDKVNKVQPAVTMAQFLNSHEYRQLKAAPSGTVTFPKDSQEEYERRLMLLGSLKTTSISLDMPPLDPENTNQPCHRFPGTMHLSADGKTRFVFLDRVHFLHFCTEQFMPWWYDVRIRIEPRPVFNRLADTFIKFAAKPRAVVHINDVMESQTVREQADVEGYAREIIDSLRSSDAMGGSVYLIYNPSGQNVRRVAALLQQEFPRVHDCQAMWRCLEDVRSARFDPPLATDPGDMDTLFGAVGKPVAPDGLSVRVMEWAIAAKADVFIGNIHSPYSRNVCLHRKALGKPYKTLRGFSEMRKIWKWNL